MVHRQDEDDFEYGGRSTTFVVKSVNSLLIT